jgi:hypothetical protein
MIADLARSYKVPRKIAHRNAMVMDQLAPQVQPRPNDQIWCACSYLTDTSVAHICAHTMTIGDTIL